MGVVDEVRPEDLKIVYVNQVLIVVTAADRILGGQLIVRAYEDLDKAFDPACRGGDIDGVSWVDLDQASFAGRLLVRDGDGGERFGASSHADDDLFLLLFVQQEIALFRSVSGKGKHEGQGFFCFNPDVERAGIRSHHTGLPAEDGHRDASQGMVVLI